MKILLDECVPRKLGGLLPGHKVTTVVNAGWKGIKNGALLKKASAGFDVFMTVDRNIAFQQDTKKTPLQIIIIHAPSIKLNDLKKCIPDILGTLQMPLVNKFYHLGV